MQWWYYSHQLINCSYGPVNQLVHQSVSITSTIQGRSKSTKWQPSIKSHDTSWIISSWTEGNEEIEGIVGALDLPIFQNSNPTGYYILIQTKRTLTPGLDTYHNPTQPKLTLTIASALICLLRVALPRKWRSMICQSIIWWSMNCRSRKTLGKVRHFAGLGYGGPGSVFISDLP